MTLWLSTVEGVIISNIRDKYTAGGRREIVYQGRTYDVPKIIKNLTDSLETIRPMLQEFDIEDLEEYWGINLDINSIYEQWCNLVVAQAANITNFPLMEYLRR